jgi:hypothetical protein
MRGFSELSAVAYLGCGMMVLKQGVINVGVGEDLGSNP